MWTLTTDRIESSEIYTYANSITQVNHTKPYKDPILCAVNEQASGQSARY